MATQRKSIRLNAHEKRLLQELYLRRRIPIDQYKKRPDALLALTTEWNQQSGRSDSPEEMIHYMITQRKQKLWVRFDGNHEPTPPHELLTAEQTEVLVDVFQEHVLPLEVCADALQYDNDLAEFVAREFAHRTGCVVPANSLTDKLIALRKRGFLPKVGKRAQDEGIGFSDIDQVGDVG